MRMPKTPPNRQALFDQILKENLSHFPAILERSGVVDEKGRYLHWDELRFKKAPEGLTHEEWWVGTRLAREVAMQKIPLADGGGRKFRFCEPQTIRSDLRYLDMNAGGALGSDARNLGPDETKRHLTRSLAEEPFASSFIEGAATTRQVAKKLIYEGRAPATRDELMVLNNYRAMQFVKSKSDDPLNMDMLLELHRIVSDGTMDNSADSGRVRTSDDVQVVDDTNNEILHQPPPYVELNARLEALFDFANDDEQGSGWIHPLLKAIILHFMLAYEHPFVDGNGRVARALFYWYACKAGYWIIEYVSISSVIAESKIDYGKAFLFVETDESDLTYFICNQLKVLKKAVDRLHLYVEKRKSDVEAFNDRLSDRKREDAFNERQTYLINELVKQRIGKITIVDHQSQHKVSYLTARNDLEKLTNLGLLRKGKSGALSIYRPVHNLFERLTEQG